MAPEVVAVAVERLADRTTVASPSPETVEALTAAGLPARHAPLPALADGEADAVALLDDELGRAGEHAEGVLADASRVLVAGGLLAVAARSTVHAAATGAATSGPRTFTARELDRLLGHNGLFVEVLCAPGAAAVLAGRAPAYDPDLDCRPGLLDAGATVVAVGRRHPGEAARSAAFFASLPRKVVAAATLCRDGDGRLLLVHDSFKRHWTIPGGVVDADEDPRAGAERETWEEAGLRVRAGRLLGLFAASWPDRLVLVYEAEPVDTIPDLLAPLHTHEIDAVEWVALDEALTRLAPPIAEQVTRCLDAPGGSWRQTT